MTGKMTYLCDRGTMTMSCRDGKLHNHSADFGAKSADYCASALSIENAGNIGDHGIGSEKCENGKPAKNAQRPRLPLPKIKPIHRADTRTILERLEARLQDISRSQRVLYSLVTECSNRSNLVYQQNSFIINHLKLTEANGTSLQKQKTSETAVEFYENCPDCKREKNLQSSAAYIDQDWIKTPPFPPSRSFCCSEQNENTLCNAAARYDDCSTTIIKSRSKV
ncbi:uncharacterized protein LOC111713765 [Eurytemora carolleeae]|uniref:uncharacterized protein LOC111713765 n=1 Tax=Eurytemora carolleeae TaxID=1294199 RepID=UPI000C7643EB|nr:uncharacterized protein LOC111713765 [Eurytemora carolleeae]|eukprot:XP_023344480.1 uncharacterized protein LOC111713765 [Eurytemora affinis]